MKILVAAVALLMIAAANESNALFPVATGFIWVENLAFSPANSSTDALFITDRTAGIIYRITRDPATQNYSAAVHLNASEIDVLLGLSVSEDGLTLFACAALHTDTNFVLNMSTLPSGAGVYSVLSYTPKIGNGMRLYDGQLYVSTEGDFLPGAGQVYRIDSQSGAMTVLSNGTLWAADGLWISTAGVLYVGELFSRKLWRYVIASGASDIIAGPSEGGWLDDFTMSEWSGDPLFYGANYELSRIDTWWENGTMVLPSPLSSGISSPTSCRFGSGSASFPATSLYITEGGGLFPWSAKDRHVWELRGAR